MSLLHRLSGLAVLASATLLTGCGNFFVCQKASCPTTPTSDTGDYAYITNSSNGATYLSAYTLSSGSLVPITGSPFSLGYIPGSAMAITPSNKFLYIGSFGQLNSGPGYIYGYSIGTDGALTILNSSSPLVSEDAASIDISPDGQWLAALNRDGETIEEYQINSTTGLLTFFNNFPVQAAAGATVTASSIKYAPTGDYLACALGSAGFDTFGFATSTGVLTFSTLATPNLVTDGIRAIAIDSSNNLYTATTLGLQAYSVTTAGVPTSIGSAITTTSLFSAVLNPDGTDLYVGNQSTSTGATYGFSTTPASSVYPPLTGSPFAGALSMTQLAADNSGDYLISVGSGSSGIQLLKIGTDGVLTVANSVAAGTSTSATAVVTTHTTQ